MYEVSSELVLYPNPVKDVVSFSAPNQNRFVSFVINTIVGDEVFSGEIHSQSHTLDLSNLKKGFM